MYIIYTYNILKEESPYQINEGFGHGFANTCHLTNIPEYLLGTRNSAKPWSLT